MKVSEVKTSLGQLDQVRFLLPNGELVPDHFHITEVGKTSKHFVDCGGTVRTEEVASFQLWNANDDHHRLVPEKFLRIINLSQEILLLEDLEVEVEYQRETISKFGLDFDGRNFLLTTMNTDCLAKANCGISSEQPHASQAVSSCSTDSGCC